MSDDTGEFFPFRDESEDDPEVPPKGRPRKGDGDETRLAPTGGDETRIVPAADDATTVYRATPESDATTVYRPVGGHDPWAEDDDEVWAGRAGVRPGGPDAPDPATGWAAEPGPEEPRGRWWTPIVVGIVALILLGLLGWGIYLIVQNTGGDEETPAPAASVTATAPAAPAPTAAPSEAPSTTPPTTTPPSAAPTTTPADLTIPALRGLSLEEARAALNGTGLNYRLRYVPSTEAPPGTVIDSDPAEGQQVPADTVVNLIIASEPTATPTTATPTTPAASAGASVSSDED
ncbi:PASTA domain-containing protein [Symbioplanes lichenis]|uniref:PASTA domain-containing protein n=1 Tax=Symbioplanes lichenis TaxID=1629072 RepID=UPI002738E732|nr:PASTA domain-containing protein [Actinoplanes lichenis]